MNLFKNVHKSWIPLLHNLAYREPLVDFLVDIKETSFQPDFDKIFNVFQMPVKDIKVVILGQDPYPVPGLSLGTAFSIPETEQAPLVLRNIKKEIYDSGEKINYNFFDDDYNELEHWVKQGIFLLNKSLTVETGSAGSHQKYWEEFTEAIVAFISEENPCIWVLWGKSLQKINTRIKNNFLVKGYDSETIEELPIDPKLNYTVVGDHPIMGKGFSKDSFFLVNKILKKRSLNKISW